MVDWPKPPVKLEPFVSVDATPFTLTPAQLVAERGRPPHSRRNEIALDEYDYGDVVYRFEDSGRLEEVTLEAQVVTIGNISVPFVSLASFVREHDRGVFERAGFLVSPRYGLAFDPREPYWVTVLAQHCLPQWEALRT